MKKTLEQTLKEQTPEEMKLRELMFDYSDKYFEDIGTLEAVNNFIDKNTDIKRENKEGKVTKYEPDLDYGYDSPALKMEKWFIKLKKLKKNCNGQCDSENKIIYINSSDSNKERKTTLLHEMIHLCEMELRPRPNLKEFCIIYLYRKLKKKRKNLDRYLCTDSHPVLAEHSPFFCLKSLDLDLRLNLKLGTIYAYGREDVF